MTAVHRARPPRLPRRLASRGVRLRAALLAAALGLAATAGRAEPLRIATARSPASLPVYLAERLGFFVDAGLDVSLVDCIGGPRCLGKLLAGQAELATSSEMPVVLRAFERPEGARPDVVVLAAMAETADDVKLVARRGGGVVRGDRLEGRRVGVALGTAAQYALELHLLAVGVDPQRVTLVPLLPEEAVRALRDARVDVVAAWEPYAWTALSPAGGLPVGERLPLSGGYIERFVISAGPRLLASGQDAMLARLLQAIDRAEAYIREHPAEAQAVLRDRMQLDQRFVEAIWDGMAWRLALEPGLLATMEAEVRWARREGHVGGSAARPAVRDLVHSGPLKAALPGAVSTEH